ncbi:MAG: hypothetical protein HW402_396 [Dehalococcoidales bacterium]|nr:hypothetical protein [Dehalococcoidales bacterium]
MSRLNSKVGLLWCGLFLFSLFLVVFMVACTGSQGLQGPAGSQGPAGPPGPLAQGAERELKATLTVSKPANGTHFVAGEKAVVAITLEDQVGKALTKEELSTLALYMYGPQETTQTVSAVKLLNATNDRSKTPHHYIDLLKSDGVQMKGNVLEYALQSVTDEEPGTYIVALRTELKGNPASQKFLIYSVQIGTATVEKQIVEKEKCASCHLGADNGQFYFHHVDPGRSPYGSPSIDSVPVLTCKACHNNDGYAAYVSPADGNTRVPDAIVIRAHGVHMGEHLSNPLNTDRKTGVFKNYLGVLFPNNVKNCTSCHVDDRWKTKPSQLACGACHDNVWFGDKASMPKTAVAHEGGAQANDSGCAVCHTPDTGGLKPIAEAHKVEQLMNKIDVSLTPSRNGKFYVTGETPMVTLVIRDDKGQPINHTLVSETTFSAANFYVYGPRLNSVPVLTNTAKNANSKARASVTSSIPATPQTPGDNATRGWTFAAGDTFKIAIHGGPVQEIAAPAGAQTTAQVVAWLSSNLKDVRVTSNAAGNINLLSNILGDKSRFEIYNSSVTTKMGWKAAGRPITREGKVVGNTAGVTMEPYVIIGNVSTAAIDMRPRTDPLVFTDPDVVRSVNNITYQLDSVSGLQPGTYMIYSYTVPNGIVAGTLANPGPGGTPNAAAKALNLSRVGMGFMTFQVGTETPDKKVATNCTNCHGSNIWHLDEGPIHQQPFDTDYCKACHDYNRSGTGELGPTLGGTSTSGFMGYGAKPLSARLHGVHRGIYLEHSEYIYAGNPDAFSEVIFPQDIRNCTKCHSADTTGTWKTEPSRLACMACHDSNKANAHAILMTQNPTPSDPWNKDRVETCTTCHGAGKEFSVDKVHNISNPYQPPYPREAE